MKTSYAVLNPSNGEYTFAKTQSELITLISQTVMDFYLSHTHGALYSIVQLNIDGSETWKTPQGVDMISPLVNAELQSESSRQMGVTVL